MRGLAADTAGFLKPEFVAKELRKWLGNPGTGTLYIEQASPWEHGYWESFNGKLRECLNASWFANLFDARRKIAAWREEYNEERPHSSLGYRTPAAFARAIGGQKGCGKDGGFAPMGNAARFPLSHSHDGGGSSLSREIPKQENRVGSEANIV